MNRIMIATDGSDGGRAALDTGAELARASGAKATLVYVRHAPSPLTSDACSRRALSIEQQRAELEVTAAGERLAKTGLDVETALLAGDPAEKILELAREQRAEVVVVGSRGNGTMAEALLGSVSGALVRHADRPVLVAKERAVRARRAA